MDHPPRISSGKHNQSKLFGLDHLRSLAIILVFIYHYGQLFPSPTWLTAIGKFGWTGVDLFFVLSGYLISSQLFKTIANREEISFRHFFIKRFFRIVPAYLVIVGIYFCIPVTRERSSMAPLWKYLTFTQNLGLDLLTQGAFSHAWSLCIEEQFYLLLPLLIIVLIFFKALKKAIWLIPGLFLFGLVIRWILYQTQVASVLSDENSWVNWYKWIYYPTFSRLDGLLSGVGIAVLFQFRPALREKLSRSGNIFLLLGILVLAGAYIVCINEESFFASVIGFPLVSLGYAMLVVGAISPRTFLFRLKSAFTTKLAALSYVIYLSHKMIIHLAQMQLSKIQISKDGNLMLIICVAACLATAFLLNRVVERPFLQLRDRIIDHRKKLVAAVNK